jgi:hypothetical protein
MSSYRFDLVCPECGKVSETVSENRVPPPEVHCGDFLMDRAKVTELKVIGITMIDQPAGSWMAAGSADRSG